MNFQSIFPGNSASIVLSEIGTQNNQFPECSANADMYDLVCVIYSLLSGIQKNRCSFKGRNKVKIVILICGEGLGHTSRCLALGNEFLSGGYEVRFDAYGILKGDR